MKIRMRRESIIWGIITLPTAYLLLIWDKLPAKVPMHWDWEGSIDRWGNRWELAGITLFLPLLIYGCMLLLPKKSIERSGRKYFQMKLSLFLAMAFLIISILHSIKAQTPYSNRLPIVGIGLLLVVLGNYFQTIRPNYFIGIRLPWTLKSEFVWRETHKLGGRLFFLIGLVIIILGSLMYDVKLLNNVIGVLLGLLVLVCTIYSFLISRREGGLFSSAKKERKDSV